jgi:hypothetical protein
VPGYTDQLFAFARWSEDEKLVIISNFAESKTGPFPLRLPTKLAIDWGFKNDGSYPLSDALGGGNATLVIEDGQAMIRVKLEPLQSMILQLPRGE